MSETPPVDPFLQRYHGYCRGILRWSELDALWQRLTADDSAWYLYAVGETPPEEPVAGRVLAEQITALDTLLRQAHDEDYCGIVYCDDPTAPRLIKVYDPNNLGSVCGSGMGPPPLPGWVLSHDRPVQLAAPPPPAGRRRWWQRLLGG